MPTHAERVAARFHEDAGFLSTNLVAEDTGVERTVIWVFAGEFSRTESQHGPRIEVVVGEKLTIESLADSVTVRLTSPPDVLGGLPEEVKEQVVEFAARNGPILHRYWQGEMATSDMIELLVRV